MSYVQGMGNHRIDKENPRTGRNYCRVRGLVKVEVRGIFI